MQACLQGGRSARRQRLWTLTITQELSVVQGLVPRLPPGVMGLLQSLHSHHAPGGQTGSHPSGSFRHVDAVYAR